MAARNQLWLLDWSNPITDRVGGGFFRALPQCPGVYHFIGPDKQILYIGQSNNLKKRINSYKYIHPDTHSKRLVKLVCRVARIEYEKCPSPKQAEILENQRISEFKPPFNRQKVFPEGYSYLSISIPFWNPSLAELNLEFDLFSSFELEKMNEFTPLFGSFKSRYGVMKIIRSLSRLLQALNQNKENRLSIGYSKFKGTLLKKKRKTTTPMTVTFEETANLFAWEFYQLLIHYFSGEDDRLVGFFLDEFSVSRNELEELENEEQSNIEFWKRWILEDIAKLDHFFHNTLRRNYLARKHLGIQCGYIEPMRLNDALAHIWWDKRDELTGQLKE